MNTISQVLGTLIHYNVEVRNTLEYCINKPTYDVRLYDEKKRAILIEIEENTPLKDIIKRSGDNGAKLETMIRDFYKEVYGDDSTIVKKAADGLRVDANQHLAIYKHVIPVYQQIDIVILGIINDAHKNKIDIDQMERLWLAEERLWSGVSLMTLTADLIRYFDEFNKAMQETKGAPNAAANFIQQDIQQIVNLINSVRASSRVTTLDYKEGVEDKVNVLIENISGRRQLKPGQKFPDVFRDTQTSISDYVKNTEDVFKGLFVTAMNDLVAQSRENAAKRADQPGAIQPDDSHVSESSSSTGSDDGADIPLDLNGNAKA